ncbi:hypothetical protein KY348_06715 [Candidatus Woesearchaeota archaeon]|nr:hypothetical protein [Candidatus Woesearchaeota archaeon]
MKNKLRLGYSNEYICFEDVNNKDLVKDRNIKCSFCNDKIRNGDWLSIIHNPGNADKPKRLHFFCLGKKCHFEWGLQGQREREG